MRRKNSSGKIPHKKTIFQNEVFDSKTEMKYYIKLLEDKHFKKIKNIKRQVEYVLQDKFCVTKEGKKYTPSDFNSDKEFDKFRKKNNATLYHAIKYRADFVITDNEDKIKVIDTKGIKTTDFELKRKLFIYRYPHLEFKVIAYYKGQWMDYYKAEKIKKSIKKTRKKIKSEGDK